MSRNTVIENKLVIVYYLAVTAILFFITHPNTVFPMSVRILLLAATVLPTVIKWRFLPAAMVLFYGIELSSFASILPTSSLFYFILIVVVFLLHNKPSRFLGKELIILLVFLILSFLHLDINPMLLWAFMALLLGDMVKTKNDLSLLAFAFIVLTIFLSALFLIYKGDFAVDYARRYLELERSQWINPNVFGATVSAGGVIASAYLTQNLHITRSRIGILLSIAAVVLASFCLSLNASRGALMSFVIPSLVLLLISNMGNKKRVLLLFLFVIGALLLFKSGYLDLLLYRAEQDDTVTGRRSIIWANKLLSFSSSGNIFDLIIGIGKTECVRIGTGYGTNMSTHNDFLTALIAYGIIGFAFFIVSVLSPIFKASSGNKATVFVLLLYLFIECFVLEPFFRGYFIEIMFFIFVLKYSLIVKSHQER